MEEKIRKSHWSTNWIGWNAFEVNKEIVRFVCANTFMSVLSHLWVGEKETRERRGYTVLYFMQLVSQRVGRQVADVASSHCATKRNVG